MRTVTFWQKPGCSGNARQRALLERAGHRVEPRDLIAEPWTADGLLAFLGPLPVAEWFNRAAPRVKCGEVRPERLDRGAALALLLSDPLLIRRPLMRRDDGACMVGFEPAAIAAWIGMPDGTVEVGEGCASAMPCPPQEEPT